ncbi:MAG: DUF2313 domain-containing protein [Pseudoflavonifractor sp.]
MGYGETIKQLLRPMGVYRLDGTVNGGELSCYGGALDGCGDALEAAEREMLLTTATETGLDKIEALLTRKPVTATLEGRRAALAALLRIGGDSFTLTAINDNLKGCGVNAVASESAKASTVEVRFPDVPGIPDRFENFRKIIEDILPCHLTIDYIYWYVTWAMLQAKFATWGALEARNLSWGEIEKLVR